MLRNLHKQNFSRGYISSNPKGIPGDYMAEGSENVMVLGNGKTRIYTGEGAYAGTGSRTMMTVGNDLAGLGSRADSEGIGSVFQVLGAWFFIGAGSLFRNGTDTTADASTTLQIKKVVAGALGTTYQAGLAQPSAPTIRAVSPPAGSTGKNNGTVSAKIARVRSATGARSNASLVSNVVTATNQSIAVTFPSADANGQDYWEIDVTKNGEGGVGNHFYLQEIPESVIAESITVSRVATNTTSIGVPNDTLTSEHLGWQYTSSGDVTTYVTAVGADDSYAAGQQAITLNAANGSANTQNGTFTRAVDGVTRTYVFEWQDADVIGSDLAPIRDYPPPAGIFAGALGDVVFVDGALGDTVDVTQYAIDSGGTRANTTTTYRGNAIAVSDPARPESFPPDNYIFTNDPPTGLLSGGQGMFWRFSRNSLGVIRYVGGSPALTYEKLWNGIGIQKQQNACLGAGGRLYAFTGQRGLVRLGVNGEPDTSFANPVSDDLAEFTAADVTLVHDANQQYILVMHGTTILAFHEGLEAWCSPCTTSNVATVKSAATVDGAAIITTDTGAAYALVEFNAGEVESIGVVYTPWIESDAGFDVVARVHASVRNEQGSDAPITIKVHRNGGGAAYTSGSLALGTAGYGHVPMVRPNVRNCQSWRVSVQMSNANALGIPGDAGFETVRVEGFSSVVSSATGN